MIRKLFTKVFGSRNDREIRQFQKSVVIINSFEDELAKLSDLELKNKTAELKERYAKGAA